MKRTKRVIRRSAIVAVILGFITTVAVAWFVAVCFRPRMALTSSGLRDMSACHDWPISRNWKILWEPWDWSGGSTHCVQFRPAIPGGITSDDRQPTNIPGWVSVFIDRVVQSWKQKPEQRSYTLRGEGWPAQAMWCSYEQKFDGTFVSLSGGIPIPIKEPGDRVDRALPYYIVWSGFLLDAASYSALWFAFFMIAWLLAQKRRQKRICQGRCPSCGYDLRGSRSTSNTAVADANDICPECGKHVAGE